MTMTRAELLRLLDERLADPSVAEAQDEQLWAECGTERALLVSDLSGFTRLTRKRGILHFLTIFRRCLNLVLPLVPRHGGRHLKMEADNVIASFPTAAEALACARAMVRATAASNESLSPDEQVHLCLGIGCGPVLELADDVFGDELNVAFKLGEDVAEPREILVSEAAMAQLEEERRCATEREIVLGGTTLRYYLVATEPPATADRS